jgi:hypothetical protein
MTLELDKMHTKAKLPRVDEGTYPARICTIADLGVQEQTDYRTGEKIDPKPRVLLTWELPTELIEVEHNDGSKEELPRLISKEYTLSNFEHSNLMILIRAIKPGLASLTELLDVECMINVGSTSNGNAKVTSVMPAPKGMPVPDLTKAASFFDFDNPDEALFLDLPTWVRIKIKNAENYSGFADEWEAVEETEEEAA